MTSLMPVTCASRAAQPLRLAVRLEMCASEYRASVCRNYLHEHQLLDDTFICYRLVIQQACKMTRRLH